MLQMFAIEDTSSYSDHSESESEDGYRKEIDFY